MLELGYKCDFVPKGKYDSNVCSLWVPDYSKAYSWQQCYSKDKDLISHPVCRWNVNYYQQCNSYMEPTMHMMQWASASAINLPSHTCNANAWCMVTSMVAEKGHSILSISAFPILMFPIWTFTTWTDFQSWYDMQCYCYNPLQEVCVEHLAGCEAAVHAMFQSPCKHRICHLSKCLQCIQFIEPGDCTMKHPTSLSSSGKIPC